MIHKWNELDYYHFAEFLESFEKKEDWTRKVVLEIQDPVAIKFGKNRRIFIGCGVKAEDYKEYNKRLLEIIEAFKSTIPDIMDRDCLSVCYLSEEDGPYITPLPGMSGSLDIIRHLMFGEKNNMTTTVEKIFPDSGRAEKWYTKDKSGNRILWIPTKEGLSQNERIIRFRTIDVEDWKRLIQDWIDGKTEEISKDDLKAEDIKILPEVSEEIFKLVQENGGFDQIFED